MAILIRQHTKLLVNASHPALDRGTAQAEACVKTDTDLDYTAVNRTDQGRSSADNPDIIC